MIVQDLISLIKDYPEFEVQIAIWDVSRGYVFEKVDNVDIGHSDKIITIS
jgi:hypothetical protein